MGTECLARRSSVGIKNSHEYLMSPARLYWRNMKNRTLLSGFLAVILISGCVTSAEKANAKTQFKFGLYHGQARIQDHDEEFYTYFHASGDYESYQFNKLKDYDSVVCWAKTTATYLDYGDSIRFYDVMSSEREIDSLKDVANAWSLWAKGSNITAPKKILYHDYGADYFTAIEAGGDSQGKHWQVNIKNVWISDENADLPYRKD
jgi:hypothetical protein